MGLLFFAVLLLPPLVILAFFWARGGGDGSADTAGLSTRLVVSDNYLYLGRLFTYTVEYGNAEASAALGVLVSTRLPPHARLVHASGGGRLVGDQVVWDVGTLPAGTSGSVTVTILLPDYVADGDELILWSAIEAPGAAGAESPQVRVATGREPTPTEPPEPTPTEPPEPTPTKPPEPTPTQPPEPTPTEPPEPTPTEPPAPTSTQPPEPTAGETPMPPGAVETPTLTPTAPLPVGEVSTIDCQTGAPFPSAAPSTAGTEIKAEAGGDAGTYLCNETFYTIMRLTNNGQGASSGAAGFVHIPGYKGDKRDDAHLDSMVDAVKTVIETTIKEKGLKGEGTILITGFKPFMGGTTNVTQDILDKLNGVEIDGYTIRVLLMDVVWGEPGRELPNAINEHKPAVIIGLGQHDPAKNIEIEETAVNKVTDAPTHKDNKGNQSGRTFVIDPTKDPNAKDSYPSTLPVQKIVEAINTAGGGIPWWPFAVGGGAALAAAAMGAYWLWRNKPLRLPIQDVFSIRGRGTVATGRVERPGAEVSTSSLQGDCEAKCPEAMVVLAQKQWKPEKPPTKALDVTLRVTLRGPKIKEKASCKEVPAGPGESPLSGATATVPCEHSRVEAELTFSGEGLKAWGLMEMTDYRLRPRTRTGTGKVVGKAEGKWSKKGDSYTCTYSEPITCSSSKRCDFQGVQEITRVTDLLAEEGKGEGDKRKWAEVFRLGVEWKAGVTSKGCCVMTKVTGEITKVLAYHGLTAVKMSEEKIKK